MTPRLSRIIAVVALSAIGASCHRTPAPSEDSARAQRLAPLLEFEAAERRARHEGGLPSNALGPDPYRIRRLADGRYVGLLRGAALLVLLDRELRELARVPAPPGATGLALGPDATVVTSGELAGRVSFHRVTGQSLVSLGSLEIEGARGVRALAWGATRVYALDALNDRVVSFRPGLGTPPRAEHEERFSTCRGPIDIAEHDGLLRVTCLFDHALVLYPLDTEGNPGKEARIVHDGPIWSSDVQKRGDDHWIALGGVEDHPLDRSIGSFGNVDSYVFLYRWRPGEEARRFAAVDVSERGVVTPKLVHFQNTNPIELDVIGYGGESRARLSFGEGPRAPPSIRSWAFPPGAASAVFAPNSRTIVANTLLDAWVSFDGEASEVRAVAPEPGDVRARLGEALFFTELMAKQPKADGALSRFSCETCHFEGGVDGRTHHTGRQNVRATTKPLFGLLENRPYFSRALDPTLAKMVDNEFRVANAGGGADPWFTLEVSEHPFLKQLGVKDERIDPLELRRALMHFLASFEHRPNPGTVGRTHLAPEERKGAIVFRDRCESCHAARRFSDEPESRVDFVDWERALLGGGLVWASSDYAKTGIEPYVAEKGARVPSLRRIVRKRPYFTNGSASTLGDLLARVRFSGKQTWHDAGHAPPGAESLAAEERSALQAFLELL